MRNILLTLATMAGLSGIGLVGTASAATAGLETMPAAALVQPVFYYDRHRVWYHHRHWPVYYHHYHHWHRWHR